MNQDLVTTSKGVVFRVKKSPPVVFRAVVQQWAERAPKAPVILSMEKDREEENPADPAYLEAKARHEEGCNMALMDAAILLCTAVENVPDDVNRPEDTDWLEDLEIMGIAPGPGKRERYLAWVKYYAAPDESDMVILS
ncbi:MAG: hypothetical protein PHU23_10085, partial [Dehalococcoidales bacterium]|nr:hypothetical protein [Dehalococcoidales bacterium]